MSTPTRTLELPDGRTVATTSTKRWQVVTDGTQGLMRRTSSNERGTALARWRYWSRFSDAWLLDTITGEIVRSAEDNTGSMRRPATP